MSSEAIVRNVVVTNCHGLHARPCLAIVNTVKGREASVTVRKGSEIADASNFHALMCFAATQGTELVISATGPEAEPVVNRLASLFADEFGISYPMSDA